MDQDRNTYPELVCRSRTCLTDIKCSHPPIVMSAAIICGAFTSPKHQDTVQSSVPIHDISLNTVKMMDMAMQ